MSRHHPTARYLVRSIAITALSLLCFTDAAAARSTVAPTTARAVRGPIYGLTQDSIANVASIVDTSRHLARFPTNRIVFDEGMPATYYRPAVRQIRPYSYVMGELLDSQYVRATSAAAYHRRVASYLAMLGTDVDIWEVGNEVNGEWLGSSRSVVAKVADAYDQTKRRGYRTSMTLYYNPDCWSTPSHEMLPWAAANVPARMKQGLDYVLVSYYEQDCNGRRPSQAQWQSVFDRLHTIFPNAQLGFGEVGASPSNSTAFRQAYLRHYYSLRVTTPGYVGGYFWWYGSQDFRRGHSSPLWPTLNAAMQTY